MQEFIILFLVFFPIATAIVSFLIGRASKEARNYFADAVVVIEFAVMLYAAITMQGVDCVTSGICGMGLHFTIDGFRGIYGAIAAFMWMMTIIFSREYFGHYRNRNRYYLFQLVTLGATIGVFLSANLYTTFIFFEIMSFTSYVWVAQDEKKPAMRAAETYLAVAVIGGMVLLMGLFLLYNAIGTLEMSEIASGCAEYPNKTRLYVAGGCLLFGFGAKAGAFPLHIWLPKAHPVAPAPASALLSGILTKAGVFGILIISAYMFYGDPNWGTLLLVLATLTMFGGAMLAVFSVDLKRTLACSSMSQIGFILVGVAMQCLLAEENGLAVWGTFLHMMNHSLIKLDLFMVAGVVYMNLHKLNLNDIRGFGRGKPFLNFSFLMGALAIGGIPLWSGYISKTLLHESIVEFSTAPAFRFVEWVFLISGGLTVAYMTKLYVALFVEKNADADVQKTYDAMSGRYMNWQSKLAIGLSALVLPVIGFSATKTMIPLAQTAQSFMRMEEHGHVPHFFSWECLKGGLISIAIGALVYVLIIRKIFLKKHGERTAYADLWPTWLDMENLIYRPLVTKILPFIGVFVSRIGDCLMDTIVVILRKTIYRDRKIPYRTGRLASPWDIVGTMLDQWASAVNGKPVYTYRQKMRRKELEHDEDGVIIRATIAYGLIMAGIAIIGVLAILIILSRSI